MINRSTKINVTTSLALQIVTILNGLVVPRLILTYFGSEINGLVSSLGQLLNYITLLEGGVSGVIMASLYKPLQEGNQKKVSGIIKASDDFFKKIALIFISYSLIVGIIYPIIVKTSFSWTYIFLLTLILAASLFTQYFYTLSYKLLLIADRRGFIVSTSQIAFVILNLALIAISIYVWPSIHVLKFVGVITYIIQPIIYSAYVKKHYKMDRYVEADKEALKQRWDGFGQNIAFFIHTNTDIVLLTIFASLEEVSVYAVYFMVANSLKSLVMSVSSAIVPTIGNVLAGSNEELKQHIFDLYEFGMGFITTFIFTCGVLLIVPFVMVYTSGITDVDYYRPLFGVLIILAEGVYCYRDPYVSAAYSSGHFKQTAKFAYIEASLNIVLSLLLVIRFGIVGVAVGTLVSMLYRVIAHVMYLQKNILFRPIKKFIGNMLFWGVSAVAGAFISRFISIEATTFFLWCIKAIITAMIIGFSLLLSTVLFKWQIFYEFIKRVIGNRTRGV